MRRYLPLTALCCATLLLLAGIGPSVTADTPTLPADTAKTGARPAAVQNGGTDSAWTETLVMGGAPKPKSP